jgi:hypothetical protein
MSQSSNLPVVISQPRAREERRRRPRPAERGVHAGYGAQLLGQPGAKRGLKGGRPVIDQAHSAYQGAEWCGFADRRRVVGGLTRAFA